jgi:hypothetical protein
MGPLNMNTIETNEKITYVYLTSVEHSGSTLMGCLMDAHPEMISIGEYGIDFDKELPCPCGSSVADCSTWGQWRDTSIERGYEFETGKLNINILSSHSAKFLEKLFHHQFSAQALNQIRDILFSRSKFREMADQRINRSIELAEILCEQKGVRVFVDTSKNPLQIRHLARSPGVNLKVISLVRDGRGVMSSLMKKEGRSPKEAISDWLYGNKHLVRAMQPLPAESKMFIRLEDVCKSPQEILIDLFNFIGVSTDCDLDFSLANRHIVGNGMRMKFDGEVKVPDESWKKHLEPKDLELFEKSAGEINRSFGYL